MFFEREILEVSDGYGRIALVETTRDSRFIRYQLKNHLGSIALELDDHTQLISYEEYSPYGNTTFQFCTQSGRSGQALSI